MSLMKKLFNFLGFFFFNYRDFLRLGSPLSCRSVEEEYTDDPLMAITDHDGMVSSLGLEEKPSTVETEKKLSSAGTDKCSRILEHFNI